ncbi:MAG: light-inducible protein [Deltaproteobacteria bacterium]|nr:light-inducible protein [Deltaproteobacteria bacterium]
MPLIKMQTSVAIHPENLDSVMKSLSDIVARETGKPGTYIMVTIEQTPMMLAEKSGDAVLFDIRGIGGLTQNVNASLTAGLCQFCSDELNVPANRVYATFTDVPRSNWGWNGNTF